MIGTVPAASCSLGGLGVKHKKIVTAAVAVGALVALAAGGYYVGMKHYQTHFYPSSFINRVGVSNRTVEEAKERISDQEYHYEFEILERGGKSETLNEKDVGLTFVHDGDVEKLMEAQSKGGSWLSHLSGQKEMEIPEQFSVSENAVKESVGKLSAFDETKMEAPVDAHIEKNENGYEVVAATQGNRLKVEEAFAAIFDAVSRQEKSIDLEASGLYETIENPTDVNALQAKVDEINRVYGTRLTYSLKGETFKVDEELLKKWVTVNEDFSVSLDEAAIGAWVDAMAYRTDTFGLKRKFKTHSGAEIELAGGGDYGWAMDEAKTSADLIAKIRAGEQNEDAQAIYQYGAYDRGVNDIGGTYVEICITDQKMWLYKDGQEVLETDVVTGSEGEGMSTPSGSVWAIDAKKSPAHFKSTNVDVNFWMPFNGGCGLHDASWRSSYGGDIYKYNGSHGCVNTPYDAVKTIYETVEIGYPVVVYYSVDQVVGPSPKGEVTAG